jgi:hypothetical protein
LELGNGLGTAMKQQTALKAAADVLCSTRSKAAANGAS